MTMVYKETEPFSYVIIVFILVSFALIIKNIVNLSRAKKYWSLDDVSKLTETGRLFKQIGYDRFLFWPKVLKGVGVLFLMICIIKAGISLMGNLIDMVYPVTLTKQEILVAIYEFTASMIMGFFLALWSFVFYYLFRVLLHRARKDA